MRHLLLAAVASAAIAAPALAANVAVIGSRGELNAVAAAFTAKGDTVTRYATNWSSLAPADFTLLATQDIIWEGSVFETLSASTLTFITNFVTNGGGFFGTPERPCCEAHNASLQSVIRDLTGDNSILIGGLGFDLFGHTFSNTPSTILTDPDDIRGISIPMDGPGRVLPGDNAPDACFVESDAAKTCTAAAWGPDVLSMGVTGRVVYYGDIDSQDTLAVQDDGILFGNIREFLLAGFSGGGGGGGGDPVPTPAAAALFGAGLLGLALVRRRRRA
jgi:hypothetical protein